MVAVDVVVVVEMVTIMMAMAMMMMLMIMMMMMMMMMMIRKMMVVMMMVMIMMIVMKQKMLMVGSSGFNLRYVFSPICRVKAAENMLLLTMLEMALAGLPTVAPPRPAPPPGSIVSLLTKRVQFHLNLGKRHPLHASLGFTQQGRKRQGGQTESACGRGGTTFCFQTFRFTASREREREIELTKLRLPGEPQVFENSVGHSHGEPESMLC